MRSVEPAGEGGAAPARRPRLRAAAGLWGAARRQRGAGGAQASSAARGCAPGGQPLGRPRCAGQVARAQRVRRMQSRRPAPRRAALRLGAPPSASVVGFATKPAGRGPRRPMRAWRGIGPSSGVRLQAARPPLCVSGQAPPSGDPAGACAAQPRIGEPLCWAAPAAPRPDTPELLNSQVRPRCSHAWSMRFACMGMRGRGATAQHSRAGIPVD